MMQNDFVKFNKLETPFVNNHKEQGGCDQNRDMNIWSEWTETVKFLTLERPDSPASTSGEWGVNDKIVDEIYLWLIIFA